MEFWATDNQKRHKVHVHMCIVELCESVTIPHVNLQQLCHFSPFSTITTTKSSTDKKKIERKL